MIIAAVDVSFSTYDLKNYKNDIFKVLSSLTPPVRVIHWNHTVELDRTFKRLCVNIVHFRPSGGTSPESFMECLPNNDPIELYIFTDGQITSFDVQTCQSIIKRKNIQFSKVHLHYIGNEQQMNLKFTDLFPGILTKIHINNNYVGDVEPQLMNFDDIDYEYIMKDDTFKATILAQLNLPSVNKEKLKQQLNQLTTRLLKETFQDKLSVDDFYANWDVDGCVSYVKKHSYYYKKADLQRKMSDIMKLFEKGIDTYSLSNFKQTEKFVLKCDDEEQNDEEQNDEKQNDEEQNEPFESEILNCDILYQKCKVGCIPVKQSKDNFWPDKKIIKNPFKLLESEELIERIVHLTEPYVIDYKNAYCRLENPDTSPFSRDELKGVFILHNDKIDVKALIKHNNYVLSSLFHNILPGNAVLWHMIFLYILATRRFQALKSFLFKEIQYLGEHVKYFLSLNPHLNPPIVATLNCCFWYIAHVCPKAFPNNTKNVLRRADSGFFLKFYQDVYENSYKFPKELPQWQLLYTFCQDKKEIFSILAHYFRHEKVNDQIILYRELEKTKSSRKFLSQLTLYQVLDVYAKFLYEPNNVMNLEKAQKRNIMLYEDDEPEEDLLSHVKINLKTCHPFLKCPETGKHWRECIGPYNREKYSYLRLFRRFCEKHKRYPQNSDDLMCFLNEFLFQRKNDVPEVFPILLRDQMDQVMKIFEKVMEMYSCKEYLLRAKHHYEEKIRQFFE